MLDNTPNRGYNKGAVKTATRYGAQEETTMTFVQIEKRNGMINLDGYSRNKTLKGALKDLAREVAKIDEGEASAITNNLNESVEAVAAGMMNVPGAYYIEAEEVHCASRYSEKKDEMEYAEGHW